MINFIIENYYIILVVCILLIFAIIGYLIDNIKSRKYFENNQNIDTYVPEEEIFIQKNEETEETEEIEEETVEDLLEEYNENQKENDSE